MLKIANLHCLYSMQDWTIIKQLQQDNFDVQDALGK